MDECEIVASGLVVTGRYSTKSLELVEEDLDEVSSAVQPPVDAATFLAPRRWANDGSHAPALDGVNEAVGVVTGVADERFALRVLNQFVGDRHLVALTCCQRDEDRPRLRVDEGVELC